MFTCTERLRAEWPFLPFALADAALLFRTRSAFGWVSWKAGFPREHRMRGSVCKSGHKFTGSYDRPLLSVSRLAGRLDNIPAPPLPSFVPAVGTVGNRTVNHPGLYIWPCSSCPTSGLYRPRISASNGVKLVFQMSHSPAPWGNR